MRKLFHIIRHFAFQFANLSHTTSTGMRILIKSEMEWRIYNDVFVDGDYDEVILKLIAKTQQKNYTILDLGFNVGFFTLRLVHLALAKSNHNNFRIQGIEASEELIKESQQRINSLDLSKDKFKIKLNRGLIGQVDGQGTFYHFKDHGLSSVFRKNGKAETIPFINISHLISDWEQVDLLKCDIEGSEFEFIKNYPDILKKTNLAIFEFHTEFCHYEDCIKLITLSGLIQRQIIRRSSHSCIELFWR